MDFVKIAEEWASRARLEHMNHNPDAALEALIISVTSLVANAVKVNGEDRGREELADVLSKLLDGSAD